VSDDKWVAVGLDPITQNIVILGLANTLEESKAQHARGDLAEAGDDVVYRRSFNLLEVSLGQRLEQWFRSCGLPRDHARKAVRDFARVLLEMFTSIQP